MEALYVLAVYNARSSPLIMWNSEKIPYYETSLRCINLFVCQGMNKLLQKKNINV